ncbi:TonB-dependent siderophore receptor [Sphingomonas koreensis]|jgi:iron complex outermembrane receptor protein|uniref:TonB-dependent receptor n=1 Tax=Sphingomonas koreensis TaxID=93064 RepID=UPI00082E3102|nr:TonB-dependent siderophore receptor [Sphingomonas koreensis]PJI89993.1 iron complex outermembrane receptor protein [Sphingomonas koreensis]RSU62551.1 TonB-dependent siderophore receptor [Sphingomonas koreensis]RSU70262.1 TonB-dependent siderophore receptor [Sphingomonas koreensis]
MVAHRIAVRGAAVAALAAALAAPAFAQETAAGEDVVITAQRDNQTQVSRNGSLGALGDKDAMDTPFAVKSYNEALILNQQPLTLGAVLENDPSVRTTLGFGNMSEQFVVRGFNLFGEDIAIDGLFGVTPRQLVSPELYDQIQILNGASAFLFGAAPGGSALGGTVNLTPKRAKDRDTNRLTANWLSDKHFGGAFDFGRRFGEGKAFGFRLNGAYRSGDIAIDGEYRRSAVVGGSFDWRTDNLRVSLDLAYQSVKAQHMRPMVQLNNKYGTVTAVPRPPRADLNYGQPWYNQTIRDVFGIFKLEYDVTESLMFYASAGARDTAERGIYQGFQLLNSTTGAAFVTGSNIPRNDNNEAAQAGLRFKGEGWGITHQLNMGYSHSRYVNRNAYEFGRFDDDAVNGTNLNNLYTPRAVAIPAFTALRAGNLADPNPANRTRLDSIFVSDTLGFADDVVQVTLGLRHQNIHFRTYNITTKAQNTEYSESTTTPVVGIVIRPSEKISLYANRIAALIQGPVAGAGTINVGQVFPPYQAVQYEIGGKVALGRFNASIAAFTTDRPQTLNEVTPGGTVFTLNGLQRNRGVEVSVDGEPLKGLRIIAGVSVTDAKQRRTAGGLTDGRDAIGVPEYTANANVEWDVYGGLTLTGRVMQTGKQAVNLTNTLELPEWTRFDLGARYVVAIGDAPVTFRFNVDNVANKRYWASSLGGYLVQGMPRTFKASATIDF